MYHWSLLVLVSCVLNGVSSKTEVINEAMDKLIEEAKKELSRRGTDRLEMEDLRHAFNRTWPLKAYELRYVLHCRDGWADGVSTARRTGDVRLTEGRGEMFLELAIGLSEIKIHFEWCELGVNDFFSTNFVFNGRATELSLETGIRLMVNDSSGDCVATLTRLELVRAEQVEFHTGGNIFHQLRDKYISRLINRNSTRAARIISNHLKEIVHEYFLVEKLCDLFHHDNRTSTT